MEGGKVDRVHEMSYPGVKFHSSLSWTKHVNEIASKCHRTIGMVTAPGVMSSPAPCLKTPRPSMLWRNLHRASPTLKSIAYQTICRPRAEYASEIWNPWTARDVNRIESIENAGAGFALNKPHCKNIRIVYRKW